MQKINSYLWKLYKESPKGQQMIDTFERFSRAPLSVESMLALTYEFDEDYLHNGSKNYWGGLFYDVLFLNKNITL